MNQYTVDGNLGSDPEIRFTSSGKQVANFSLAHTERHAERDETMWIDVTCWEWAARQAAELKKGDTVGLSGKLRQDNWEDSNGNKRSKICMTAFEVFKKVWPPREAAQPATASEHPLSRQQSQPEGPVPPGYRSNPAQDPYQQKDDDQIPF